MTQAAHDTALALVLHAHLPFVRHPERAFFLEEAWLFEAITETYIPLLQTLDALAAEGVEVALTLVLSPALLCMLDDRLLRARYARHLRTLRALVEVELRRVDDARRPIARHYQRRLAAVDACWQRCGGDLPGALWAHARAGRLDVMTCAATHGYLPLLREPLEAVRAQIRIAVDHHTARFGSAPTGIWLPECAYYPGLDAELQRAGLRYFVVDAHAVDHAEPPALRRTLAPVFLPDTGVAAFPRDIASANEVWSRHHGYPGDPAYREYYRDIGYELPEHALAPFGLPPGVRKRTGIAYHRITGDTEHKALYEPARAAERACEHALDFIDKRVAQGRAARLLGALPEGQPALVVAPYDAELFGHWWYEGPLWLSEILRRAGERGLSLTHLRGYLERHDTHQLCRIAESSWGEGGYHAFWLDESNAWIYPRLRRAAERLVALASSAEQRRRQGARDDLRERALAQAARELLLAQSSDWAFIMRNGTSVEYAARRTRSHLARFDRLAAGLETDRVDLDALALLEKVDNCFAGLDYRVFAREP